MKRAKVILFGYAVTAIPLAVACSDASNRGGESNVPGDQTDGAGPESASPDGSVDVETSTADAADAGSSLPDVVTPDTGCADLGSADATDSTLGPDTDAADSDADGSPSDTDVDGGGSDAGVDGGGSDAGVDGGGSGTGVDNADAGPASGAPTLQDFSELLGNGCPGNTTINTPYACFKDQVPAVGLQTPWVMAGGEGDPFQFLRVAEIVTAGHDHDAIAFERTAAGAYPNVVADFDFRVSLDMAGGRADGFGFALVSTALSPTGMLAPPLFAETPSFPGSFGVGFNIYSADPNNPYQNITANFNDSTSLYFNGAKLYQVDLEKISDIASGLWHHVRLLVSSANGGSTVSMWLAPPCGVPVLVADAIAVPGAVPYESRAWFGARSGGESANFDVANIRVNFMQAVDSWVSFDKPRYEAQEDQGTVTLTVLRSGDLTRTDSVGYETADRTAQSFDNYEPTQGTVVFAPGQASQTIAVVLTHNPADQSTLTTAGGRTDVPLLSRSFWVKLTTASSHVNVAGPAVAEVAEFDAEASQRLGHWGAPMCWNIIAMNSTLMPTTGTVLYWDRLGNVGEWDPTTEQAKLMDGPGYDLFCAGHSLLADGTLLISGGDYSMTGIPILNGVQYDGIGVANLTEYDPLQPLPWQTLPTMNANRWYPTVTTLSNGSALILSGSLDANYDKNLVPEVYIPSQHQLVDLNAGPNAVAALGGQLYPWMFAIPNGKAIKVGPDPDPWIFDTGNQTAGQGTWTATGTLRPDQQTPTGDEAILDYGSAMLLNKTAFTFGGGGSNLPLHPVSNLVNAIDLQTFAWTAEPGMLIARRMLNSTSLPDGRILITGGSYGNGFSNIDTPATPAEIFDGNAWTLLPAEMAPRLYHSTATLMADGRVVAGGGGEGGGLTHFQSTAETFYPDYWFKNRPTLLVAPTTIAYDAPFSLKSSTPISKVTLIRSPSVTHSFNQNQRYMELPFTATTPDAATPTDVTASVASDGWVPPGHYLLFVLDQSNVPSVGVTVRIGP